MCTKMSKDICPKCFWCYRVFDEKDAYVGFDSFIHCPKCGQPLFDVTIQDYSHWIWKHLSEKEKRKYGYYEKLENKDDRRN